MMSEIFHIFRKCPNRLNFLQGEQYNKTKLYISYFALSMEFTQKTFLKVMNYL